MACCKPCKTCDQSVSITCLDENELLCYKCISVYNQIFAVNSNEMHHCVIVPVTIQVNDDSNCLVYKQFMFTCYFITSYFVTSQNGLL